MVVQHNLTAMNSNRMLGVTTSTQAKTTEKLSSGYKINRAADDAAGLAISEKMRKQIRGLTQASANAQDGISAVQTAEGALTEVHDMLQRMNELAVKAGNGTQSESDRAAVQAEIEQLTTEIDRVAETTKFNETYLLKGDTSATAVKGYNFSYKPVSVATGDTAAQNVVSKITMSGTVPGKHEGTGITITPTQMKEGDNISASADDINLLLKSIRDQGLSVTALSEHKNGAVAPTNYNLALNGDAAKKFKVVTTKEAKVEVSATDDKYLVNNKMVDALRAAYDADMAAEGKKGNETLENYKNLLKVFADYKVDAVNDATKAGAVGTALEAMETAITTYKDAVAEYKNDNPGKTEAQMLADANFKTNKDAYDTAITEFEKTTGISDLATAVAEKLTDSAIFEIRDASDNKLMEVSVSGYAREAQVAGDVFTDTVTMTAASVKAFEKATDRAQYYDKDGNKISENALGNYVAAGMVNGATVVMQKAGTKLYDALGNETSFKKEYIDAIQDRTATLRFGLHVGSDATRNNQISVNIDSMSAKGLGIVGLRVDGANDNNALGAIATIKAALEKVSAQRSDLGAVQNRLEHTINNLGNVVENTTSAESAIRDTDMATTMVQFSNNNILAQAGTSMLAQANQSNQSVLSLLQ